jgi:predicted house-cleaning noncanonical NTP pyrophosphatase (MazG superfamily)
MIFRKFKQNKLWRDKAIDLLEKNGSKIHWTRLNDHDFAVQLKAKFMEEAQEVYNASTRQALLEELADIVEVMHALGHVHSFTLEDIIAVQRKKQQDRGGFTARMFVTVAEHPIDSFGERYCLADPEKYPEIID